ncbi:MAG: SGNH/GDSL hydrolase family protein [bacterium]
MNIQPAARKVIFALAPLVIILLLTELGLRIVYFSVAGNESLATVAAAKYLKREIMLVQAAQQIDEPNTQLIKEALYTEDGSALLDQLKQEYETNLLKLIESTRQIDSKLVIVYLPVYHDSSIISPLYPLREFYRELADKYQLSFLDLTEHLANLPPEQIYLIPEDGHFSRYGNQLVAAYLHDYLLSLRNHYSAHHFNSRPALFGDLQPNQNTNWLYKPNLPYQVVSNSQGLRLTHNLQFPKTKQRILFLGDSYTFSPYLSNQDTHPDLLAKLYPEAEIVNAGIAGYTITDEASLFIERAKFMEPDITVLQVSENDIVGLLSFNMNRFDRRRQVYLPTPAEQELLQKLQQREHN